MKFFPWEIPDHFLDHELSRMDDGIKNKSKLVNTLTVDKFVEYDPTTLEIWRQIQERIKEGHDVKAFKILNDLVIKAKKNERYEVRVKLAGLIGAISENDHLLKKNPLEALLMIVNILANPAYWDCDGDDRLAVLRDELIDKLQNLSKKLRESNLSPFGGTDEQT